MRNYISNSIKEFPYRGRFYRLTYDMSKPLSEQTAEEVELLQTECNILDAGSSLRNDLINASYRIYFPTPCTETFPFNKGDRFESSVDGFPVKGEVIGIFPSQLRKVQVYIKDFDV